MGKIQTHTERDALDDLMDRIVELIVVTNNYQIYGSHAVFILDECKRKAKDELKKALQAYSR